MMKKTLLSLVALLMTTLCYAQDLPQATLRDLNGKPVKTSTFLQSGKPIILSFFGTWCKPCLRELDAVQEVYADWQAETGVTLYAVSIDEGADVQKVRPTVHAHGWEFVVLTDTNSDLKRMMNVSAVPALFIFDGSGKLLDRRTGYVEGSEGQILQVLREAVASSPKK
ncbi:TlpA disulfide reductase family protein [uncultured Porphyromonas sp.]|uniref:TlpA family protein disulfide reductase n=1 Tax=uncultured Porphyromonas sp. TaxID=159274 RepID=UPI00342F8E00